MSRKVTERATAGGLSLCTAALALAGSVGGLLISGKGALADAGLAGFANISSASDQRAAPKKKTVAPGKKTKPAAEPWGPVPTDKLSIANAAPVLLPYFNNGPSRAILLKQLWPHI